MSESDDDEFPFWLVLVIVCAVITLIFCFVVCCVIRCFSPEQTWGPWWYSTEDGVKQFVDHPRAESWRREGDNQLKQKETEPGNGQWRPYQDNSPEAKPDAMGTYPRDCPDKLQYRR